MFELVEQVCFTADHALRSGGRPNERPHPHRWRVVVTVRARSLDAHGFVLDFPVFAALLREAVAPLEGRSLNTVPPFDHVNPTAEALAQYLAAVLLARLPAPRVTLHCVRVFKGRREVAYYPPEA